MKAYVIKDKKGKYWNYMFYDESDFHDELCYALMDESRKSAEETIKVHGLKDCKVVEVTIVEGDLEQQLAAKDKLIKEINKAYIETYARERQKDHRIDVLEKALELACREHKIFGYCCYSCAVNCDKTVLTCEECCAEYFIEQAKKELEGKK